MRLALLCIALLGCSSLAIPKPEPKPPWPIWPHTNYKCTVRSLEKKFQAEMVRQGILILDLVPAKLVDKLHDCVDDKDAVGCTTYAPEGIRIELLKSFWDRVDCGWREVLVFHEHGHADLLLGHQDNTLMDPYVEGGYACMLRGRQKCLAQMANMYKIVLLFRDAEIQILQTRQLHRHGDRVHAVCKGAKGL